MSLHQRIVIDGVEYVPKNSIISEESQRKLAKAYGISFSYGSYDEDTNPEHLREIFNLLLDVNQEVKFRR